MKLNIGEKELNIKFGYKSTLKERIISNVVRFDNNVEEMNAVEEMERLEDLLLFLPEFLLSGVQVHHEEYRYDYDTKEGKEKHLEEMFHLIEKYSENQDADYIKLFRDLTEEMLKNSFLKKIFQKEQEEVATKTKLTKKEN